MNSIELMVYEHTNIKRMLKVIRAFCQKLYNKEEVDFADMDKMTDFVKNYADKHHHGKEEQLLFNRMVEHLGPAAQKLVTHGMLVEHDMGRLFMMELKNAIGNYINGQKDSVLDIIANAISYTHLLERHIQKEDDLVYKFAEKNLAKELMDKINDECVEFEEVAKREKTQEKYLTMLEEMENKYLV